MPGASPPPSLPTADDGERGGAGPRAPLPPKPRTGGGGGAHAAGAPSGTDDSSRQHAGRGEGGQHPQHKQQHQHQQQQQQQPNQQRDGGGKEFEDGMSLIGLFRLLERRGIPSGQVQPPTIVAVYLALIRGIRRVDSGYPLPLDASHTTLLRAQVRATGMAALLSLRLGEGGAGLSLGQQQQLCLARLLMRRPRIIVLDEATAHVDAGAAAAMHGLVADKFSYCTVLSIAVGPPPGLHLAVCRAHIGPSCFRAGQHHP